MTLGNLRLNPKTWNKSYVNITILCSSYVFVFIPATEHNLIVRSTKQLTTAFIDINSLEVMNGLHLGCIISFAGFSKVGRHLKLIHLVPRLNHPATRQVVLTTRVESGVEGAEGAAPVLFLDADFMVEIYQHTRI